MKKMNLDNFSVTSKELCEVNDFIKVYLIEDDNGVRVELGNGIIDLFYENLDESYKLLNQICLMNRGNMFNSKVCEEDLLNIERNLNDIKNLFLKNFLY